MRRTKIICTVGPASNSWETIRDMYNAGMNVLRINMSHATHDDAERAIRWVATLNRNVQHTVPILLDTAGPEIRTGRLAEPMRLRRGSKAWVSSVANGDANSKSPRIEVNYPEFNDHVGVGDRIRLDNGLINLEVVSREEDALLCEVADGGMLGSNKHVNLPGVHVKLPSITAKDKEDVRFGLAHAISYVAQSFVRTAEDIRNMRELIGERHSAVKIIAKIENQEGVEHIEDIADASHGIMVARGDLGIETNLAELPFLQQTIVEKTLRAGKRCIVSHAHVGVDGRTSYSNTRGGSRRCQRSSARSGCDFAFSRNEHRCLSGSCRGLRSTGRRSTRTIRRLAHCQFTANGYAPSATGVVCGGIGRTHLGGWYRGDNA